MSGVRIERQGRLSVLRLDKARGNAIDAPLVEALIAGAGELAKDDSVGGVLLASAHPRLFCPGLDLVSLSGCDRKEMDHFMARFAEAVWALYGLPRPVVAAVSGPAVAGGCILALTADYRVLKRGAPIGLNEVKIGVPLPWSVTLLLRATVHAPALSRIALLGSNFADDEALSVGLVDELAEAEGFETNALARLAEFVDRDPVAVATTKAWLREGVLAEMKAREAERRAVFVDRWFSESTQAWIHATVEALSKKA
jgi:enoyl-CoA hydratase/carnithine racemase